ncbi:MAG: type 4a pilus biogenesis protein PilO [Candidatus Omnitrophica bacterium]|nr:type 4a pilus biogenesis protein PilO [Candidatus Omnitrophota bacterium]
MNFNLSKIKELPVINWDKKKVTTVGLTIVIFLIFDFYFILGAQIKRNRNIELEIKKLKTKIKSFNDDFLSIQRALKNSSQQVFRIIGEDELSSLVEEISNLARQNNVEISQIMPQKETKSAASSSTVNSYLFYLTLNSDYYSLLKFIDKLEKSLVIITVEELDILQNPNNIFKHNINLTLRIYVKK